MEYLLGAVAVLGAIILAVFHNKKDQSKIMKYYESSSEQAFSVSEQSLKNQERMIEILEEISKKLEK